MMMVMTVINKDVKCDVITAMMNKRRRTERLVLLVRSSTDETTCLLSVSNLAAASAVNANTGAASRHPSLVQLSTCCR